MRNNHQSMSTIKELLGQGDIPKPKRNFLQENVRRLKEMKLEKTNKFNSHRSKNLQLSRADSPGLPTVIARVPFLPDHSAWECGGKCTILGIGVWTALSYSRCHASQYRPLADPYRIAPHTPHHVNLPLAERRNTQMMAGSSRNQQEPSSPPRTKRTGLGRVRHVTVDSVETSTLSADVTPKGYRSQGCQTLNSHQLENLYQEGVIRYPSARHEEGPEREVVRGVSVREMGLQTDTEVEVLHPPPDNTGLHWDEESGTEAKDFVRMNATIPEAHRHRTAEHWSSGKTDPTRAPPSYQRGVIPKYLKEHKKELQRERITKAKEAADDCPEGHVLLPEDIKQQHLITLKQKYGELVSQLNQLPVSTDTLRTRTRKKQIETDLDRIETAIALFSREKVFVQADS